MFDDHEATRVLDFFWPNDESMDGVRVRAGLALYQKAGGFFGGSVTKRSSGKSAHFEAPMEFSPA